MPSTEATGKVRSCAFTVRFYWESVKVAVAKAKPNTFTRFAKLDCVTKYKMWNMTKDGEM